VDGREVYGSQFFADQVAGSARAAEIVLPLVLGWLRPNSVLDVGCGTGSWLRVASHLGVGDTYGIDGYATPQNLVIPPDRFQIADLTESFDVGRRFELVISLEVAEHLDESSADVFVRSLCGHADAVLFSAAIPGQGGTAHVNEQWPSYWAAKFAANGFEPLDLIRPRIWDDPQVEDWYRQNTLLFATGGAAAALRLVTPNVPPAMLDLVHPSCFLFHTSDRPTGVRVALRHARRALRLAVTRRLRRRP
jgi:SAM-dependent methyltransferase